MRQCLEAVVEVDGADMVDRPITINASRPSRERPPDGKLGFKNRRKLELENKSLKKKL